MVIDAYWIRQVNQETANAICYLAPEVPRQQQSPKLNKLSLKMEKKGAAVQNLTSRGGSEGGQRSRLQYKGRDCCGFCFEQEMPFCSHLE